MGQVKNNIKSEHIVKQKNLNNSSCSLKEIKTDATSINFIPKKII